MKFELSSGGVVFKKDFSGKIYYLITRSSPSKDFPDAYWRLPKGWLDDDGDGPGPLARGEIKTSEEALQKTAMREVKEEGGVEARIIRKIGTKRIFFTKSGERLLKFITYYLMEWEKDIPDGPGFETSKTGWLLFEKAKARIKYKPEKEVLQKANELLASGIQTNLI